MHTTLNIFVFGKTYLKKVRKSRLPDLIPLQMFDAFSPFVCLSTLLYILLVILLSAHCIGNPSICTLAKRISE